VWWFLGFEGGFEGVLAIVLLGGVEGLGVRVYIFEGVMVEWHCALCARMV
jgi:hypothetical protein